MENIPSLAKNDISNITFHIVHEKEMKQISVPRKINFLCSTKKKLKKKIIFPKIFKFFKKKQVYRFFFFNYSKISGYFRSLIQVKMYALLIGNKLWYEKFKRVIYS